MSTNWLTQEAFDRLSKELDYLLNVGRQEIAAQIAAARSEGDIKENGGYHAAREEQAKQEARISQITEMLRNAQVGEPPADDGLVSAGKVISAKIAGKEHTFLLGSREAAAGTTVEVFPETSPLGNAIIGHKVGEKVEYKAPNGKTIPVEIISAKPYSE